MAQKVLVQLVDDLDGRSSDDISTIHFGLDGVEYEIDLSESNASHLRGTLADYVDSARRTGGRIKRGVRSNGAATRRSSEAAKIRNWAEGNGFELAGRGRIPSHVIDAYEQAQREPVKSKAKPNTTGSRRRTTKKK